MNKKIVYLGGLYQAERSIRQSFVDNGDEIIFLIDNNPFGVMYMRNDIHPIYDKQVDYIKVIPMNRLYDFLQSYKPDVVIHRYFKRQPIMHNESFNICSAIGIPHVIWKAETSGSETLMDWAGFNNTNLLLYAHDWDKRIFVKVDIPIEFYPYGVSNMEKSIRGVEKKYDIAAFGFYRNSVERVQSLNFFIDAIKPLGFKLNVFGFWHDSRDGWALFRDDKNFSHIQYNGTYPHNAAVNIMNQTKIAVNVESLWHVEGMYSHKMWETLGCGVPTLTWYKPSVNKLFNGNDLKYSGLGFVTSAYAVELAIETILNNYTDISVAAENYVHEHFDWYNRFDKIMKDNKLW